MRKIFVYGALALAATLAACSSGGAGNGGAMPAKQSNGASDMVRQKQLREEQRVPSTFVAAKHPGYLPEAPVAENWHTGISEAGEAPVPGGMFVMTNQYNTTENGKHVTIYAGARKATGEGVLLVVTRSADLHTATAQTFTVAPSAVRIQSAVDGQVQLQTISGSARDVQFRVPF